jgi:acyl-CoA synthetase (AMP-forming)/AMP-acid ligase II
VLIGMLRHPDLDRHESLVAAQGYYGAAIVPIEILREISERLPDVRLWSRYGQTEMAPVAVMLQPEDQIRKAGSAGRGSVSTSATALGTAGDECERRVDRRETHVTGRSRSAASCVRRDRARYSALWERQSGTVARGQVGRAGGWPCCTPLCESAGV